MSALDDLLSVDQSAEVELLVRIHPRDPETGGTVPVLLTTAKGGLQSAPTDSPPNEQFLERLLRGWTLELRLSQPGQLLEGAGATSYGTLLVDDSRQEFARWPDLEWNAAEIEIMVGGRVGADGRRFPVRDFEPLLSGLVDTFRRGPDDSTWEISLRGQKHSADLPFVLDTYRGFGGALRVADDVSWIEAADDTPILTGGARTIEWIGVVPTLHGVLWEQDGRFNLSIETDGRLRMQLLAGMTVLDTVESAAGTVVVDPHRPRFVALVIGDGATPEVRIHYGTGPDDWAEVASGTLSGAINETGTAALRLGTDAGGTILWEARISDAEFTGDELANRIFAPVFDLAEASLVEAWQFDDAVGDSVLGGKSALDLAFEGEKNLTWLASLDGDDPVGFGGGPIGQSRPDGWGTAFGVPLSLVDTPRGGYQAGIPSSTEDVLRLYVDGAPLVPDETITAAGSEISFADPDVESFTLSGDLSAHRLIAHQNTPERLGQNITITGSTSNDGEVEVLAVSADGKIVTTGGGFHAETSVAGTEIRTSAADRQYTYDIARSAVFTPTAVQGQLTAHWRFRSGASGDGLYSEALAYTLGAAVDSSALLWDPPVAFPVLVGEAASRRETAARLALSACAWLLERPDGTFATGTLVPAVAAEAAGRLGPGNTTDITLAAETDPFRRITVGWGRTWQTIDRAAMAGSLTTTDRERHAVPWRYEPRDATAATLREFPLAQVKAEAFETYLVTRADALRWLDYAAALYLQPRRWYAVEASGLGALLRLPGSVYYLEHPDHTLKLPAGTLGRVMSGGIESSSQAVTVEVLV